MVASAPRCHGTTTQSAQSDHTILVRDNATAVAKTGGRPAPRRNRFGAVPSEGMRCGPPKSHGMARYLAATEIRAIRTNKRLGLQ